MREASKTSTGVCGATGLVSELLGVLNSDKPGYRLEEVVSTGLRILEGAKGTRRATREAAGHGTTLGNHRGFLLPLESSCSLAFQALRVRH